jgi:hypothetical protein
LWREARRLRDPVEHVDIERVRRCADKGDWCGFCRSIGWEMRRNPLLKRRTSLQLWREETGELNKYGECRGPRLVGLRLGLPCVVTRPHRWKILGRGSSSAIFRGAVAHAGARAPLATDDGTGIGRTGTGTRGGAGGQPGIRCSSPSPSDAPLHRWRIERKGASCPRVTSGACGAAAAPPPVLSSAVPSALGPVAITVRGQKFRLVSTGPNDIRFVLDQNEVAEASQH